MGRRILVRKEDVLLVNGYELTGEALRILMDPAPRLLWAFVARDGDIQPIPYDETHCVWLTAEEVAAGPS